MAGPLSDVCREALRVRSPRRLRAGRSLADEAADMGEDLLEASEDIVETIEEQVPGGGVVGQAIDVVLLPGRLGLRVATTVLKGSPKEGSD